MRLLIYILIFYFIFRIVKYFIKKKWQESYTEKEFYTIDEYGIPRKEKDITQKVKIINEKRLNEYE